MNMMKNMALMAMGGMMTFAFMKYKEPMKKAMIKAMDKEKEMASKMLEDMM